MRSSSRLLVLALCGAIVVSSLVATDARAVNEAAMTDVSQRVADAWLAKQIPDGPLTDRFSNGAPVFGYGTAMTGLSIAQHGLRLGDPNRLTQGIRIASQQLTHPNDGGFEMGVMAQFYNWAQASVPEYPTWVEVRPAWEQFLRTRAKPKSGDAAVACLSRPECYVNLKLVEAVGNLELLRTGLTSDIPGTKLNNREALREATMHLLAVTVPANTSRNGRRGGSAFAFDGAGIISDPSRNPLAYHTLSSAYLARAIELLDGAAPQRLRSAYWASTRALVGFIAPDGDITYIGRGQGQVWTLGLASYSMAAAARWRPDAPWGARYQATQTKILQRLLELHQVGEWGFALVPRLNLSASAASLADPRSGIDGYAGTAGYNGLALWGLDRATAVAAGQPPLGAASVGGDNQGYFIDPSATGFATWRVGKSWGAFHWGQTHGNDARYDFGWVSLKSSRGGWHNTIPPRPLTSQPQSMGPVLVDRGKRYAPRGDRMSVSGGGNVRVDGRWGRLGTSLVSKALGKQTWRGRLRDGVASLQWDADRGEVFEFTIWWPKGSRVLRRPRSLVVTQPGNTRIEYRFSTPIRAEAQVRAASGGTVVAASAYHQQLFQSKVRIVAPRDGVLRYEIRSRR